MDHFVNVYTVELDKCGDNFFQRKLGESIIQVISLLEIFLGYNPEDSFNHLEFEFICEYRPPEFKEMGEYTYRPDFFLQISPKSTRFIPLKYAFELDGNYHNSAERIPKDKIRDRKFKVKGYSTIRFTKKDIEINYATCTEEILRIICKDLEERRYLKRVCS